MLMDLLSISSHNYEWLSLTQHKPSTAPQLPNYRTDAASPPLLNFKAIRDKAMSTYLSNARLIHSDAMVGKWADVRVVMLRQLTIIVR